jgi:phage terminase small subunit
MKQYPDTREISAVNNPLASRASEATHSLELVGAEMGGAPAQRRQRPSRHGPDDAATSVSAWHHRKSVGSLFGTGSTR